MNDKQLREILAQEYEKAGFPASRYDEIRNGTGILPDRSQAALNACRRVNEMILNEVANAAEDFATSIRAKAE